MAAPTIDTWAPIGTQSPDVIVSFNINDVDSDTDENTIDVSFSGPSSFDHVIINGVFQAGYTGTISTVGQNTTVSVLTHPFFIIGSWQIDVYAEDGVANSVSKTWTFTVSDTSLALSSQNPIGIKTGSLTEISCAIDDDWGLDTTTLGMTMISSTGTVYTIISAGAIQTGWGGVVIGVNDDGDGPKHVNVIINSFPAFTNGQLYTFGVDIIAATLEAL